MKQATKAALFSFLLFPGGGQIYLKRYARGMAFLAPAAAATLALAWMIFQAVLVIVREVLSGAAGADGVLQGMGDGLRSIDMNLALWLLIFILLLWLGSTIDAYCLGKKIEPPTTSVNR
jgi:TM2 domain-containing membrane protein YozV